MRDEKIESGDSIFFKKCDFEPESRFMNPESAQLYAQIPFIKFYHICSIYSCVMKGPKLRK